MLDENNSKFTLKDFILQILFVVLFLFILMWLFPTKQFMTSYVDGALDKKLDQKLDPIYARFFNENIASMQEAAKSYFTTPRLPKKVGDTQKITLKEMLEQHLLIEFTDSNGKTCDLEKSYAEVTKQNEEYIMKVNLACSDNEDYILVHMGCYQYCTTAICEKQATTTVVAKDKGTVKTVSVPKTASKTYLCEYQKVTNAKWGNYSGWSNWTSNKIDKTNYNQVETKTVKVYVGTNTVAQTKVDTAAATNQNKTTYTCDNSYDNAGTYTKSTTCTKSVNATKKTTTQKTYANGVAKTTKNTTTCNKISKPIYKKKTQWSAYQWYDSYKAASSGWKCTNKRKVPLCNTCTSHKTQWYCAYSYTKNVVSGYNYVCPSGCYMSNNKCYKTTSKTTWSCPAGYTKSSGSGKNLKCVKNVTKTTYTCGKEYNNAGTYTKATTCKKTSAAKVNTVTTYVCPKGYDNAGTYTKETTCKKSTKEYRNVDQYKNVTYYRQKTRKLNAGNKYIKWSNCNDRSLINGGYSKTGKQKVA